MDLLIGAFIQNHCPDLGLYEALLLFSNFVFFVKSIVCPYAIPLLDEYTMLLEQATNASAIVAEDILEDGHKHAERIAQSCRLRNGLFQVGRVDLEAVVLETGHRAFEHNARL